MHTGVGTRRAHNSWDAPCPREAITEEERYGMGQNIYTTWTYEGCARSTAIRDRTRYPAVEWGPLACPAVPTGSAPVTLRWSGLVHANRHVLVDAMCVLLTTPVVLKSLSSYPPSARCAGPRHSRPNQQRTNRLAHPVDRILFLIVLL